MSKKDVLKKVIKFDPKQVRMGMKVEREHNSVTGGDKRLIRQIVYDHLRELPDYYTRLAKMEKKDK
jgi:hypothetical protein